MFDQAIDTYLNDIDRQLTEAEIQAELAEIGRYTIPYCLFPVKPVYANGGWGVMYDYQECETGHQIFTIGWYENLSDCLIHHKEVARMNIKDMFPSQYLHHRDLRGKQHIVTIKSIKAKMMKGRDDQDERKFMLGFVEKINSHHKPMILNKTNAMKIAEVLDSDETKDWLGKQITIYPALVNAFGKETPAIRVLGQELEEEYLDEDTDSEFMEELEDELPMPEEELQEIPF